MTDYSREYREQVDIRMKEQAELIAALKKIEVGSRDERILKLETALSKARSKSNRLLKKLRKISDLLNVCKDADWSYDNHGPEGVSEALHKALELLEKSS